MVILIFLMQAFLSIGSVVWADAKDPVLIVSGGKIPVVNAGEEVKLSIPIENIGPTAAKNIQVIMQLDEESPFVLEELNSTYIISKLNSKKTDNAIFKIKIRDDAIDKVYSVKLLYYYSNMAGTVLPQGADTIKVRVENSKKPPQLTLSTVSYGDMPLIAGESKIVSAIIRNTGDLEAKDVKVYLKGLSPNVFTLKNSPDVKSLPNIGAEKVIQVDYIIIPSLSMDTGNYDLTLEFDYKDSYNNPFSEKLTFFLPVQGLDTNLSNLIIKNISVPDKELNTGESFAISFDVINESSIEADDVRVSLSIEKDIICKSLNIISLGKLTKDETKSVEFELYTTAEAVTKNYPIQINVEFESGIGGKKVKNNISQYVGVFVNGGTGSSTPKIIVDRYNIEPSTIKAGDSFQLTMSLLNTSSYSTVSNIKVSLISDDGVFNPVDSSNTIYIESIKPKENIQKVFTLMPKRDAEHKTYGISVNIDYEDEKGNQLGSKDIISVPVIQQVKLVLGDLMLPPEVFLGQSFPVSIEFFNMGKTVLYNLMIKTEGNFTTQNSNYYVGNFEAGKTDSYDVGIIPNEEGQLKGSIIFSFENAVGEAFDVVKEFETNAIMMQMEPMPEPGFDDNMGEGNEGKFIKLVKNPYAIGGFLLIIVGAIVIVRKKHKKKKEMWLDE